MPPDPRSDDESVQRDASTGSRSDDQSDRRGESPAVVECPPSGKRVAYLDTADDTDGECARFEMWLEAPPASHGPMKHVHPAQDEVLAVVEGRMGLWHEGEARTLEAGETATIPKGERHRFWNAGPGELHVIGEVRPALRTEEFMYVTYGLARDGLSTPSGMPLDPLRLAVLVEEYDDLLYLAALPVKIQKLGVRLLAALGRRVGYDNDYPEYLLD